MEISNRRQKKFIKRQAIRTKTFPSQWFLDLHRNRTLLTMTLPGIFLLFGFSYLPKFGLVIAFKNFKADQGIWGSEWVGASNFRFLFDSEDAWRITGFYIQNCVKWL